MVEPSDAAAVIAAAALLLSPSVVLGQSTSPPPPAWDPALNAPLEPLKDAATPPAVAPPPTVADTQGAVPPADPELGAPLQPLESFTVDTRPAPGAAPAAPAAIPYRLEVVGVDPKSQVMHAFRAGSALAHGKNRADDAAQLALRVREDQTALASLMRAYGYFDAQVDALVEPAATAGAPVQVRLEVVRNGEYRLGAIAVSGPPTRPPSLAREALPLKTGEPIVAPAIEAAEAQVRLRLPQEGYPFLKVGQRDIVLDEATHTGDYTLPVEPGARAVFGRLDIIGKPVLPQKALDVMPRFHSGQLYDSRLVDDLRRALVSTGLYATVGVADHDTGARTAAADDIVDLDVSGTRGKTHTISGTLGYDTGLGASAGLSWTDRDFLKPEGALTLRGLYGTQQSLVGLDLRQNNFPGRDESLDWLAQVSQEDIDPYNARTAQLGVTLARESTPIWQKRWTWSLGALGMVSQETGWDINLGAEARRTYEIIALPMMLTYDRSNSLLDPTKGYRLSFTPSPEVSIGKGTQPYVRLLFEATAYQPILPALSFAERFRVGSIEGADSQSIAPSRRFYSGGGGSVRGYDFESLGPQAPANAVPTTIEGNSQAIGGASLNEVSFESRYRISRDWGVVGFIDGGQAYLQSTPQFRDLRWGVGAGVRYFTGFGPLRLDLAVPIDRRPGETPVAVYISIGQAF